MGRVYEDGDERVWTLEIDAVTVVYVREQVGENLCEVLDDKASLLERIYNDQVLFVSILAALLTEQIESQKVDAKTFAKAHGGDVLWAAQECFQKELIDFFPNPQARKVLSNLMAKSVMASGIMMETIETQLEKLTPELMAKRATDYFTNSPLLQELPLGQNSNSGS